GADGLWACLRAGALHRRLDRSDGRAGLARREDRAAEADPRQAAVTSAGPCIERRGNAGELLVSSLAIRRPFRGPSSVPVSLLYALAVLIWGTSWFAIELQIGVVPPELSVAYRFVLAAGMLLLYCAATGRRLRFPLRDHLFMALQGLFLFSLNYMLFYAAAPYLASGLLAVCFSTIVVMNIANGALLFRHPVDPRVAAGAVLGLFGLGLVFWPEIAGFSFSGGAMLGLGLSVAATYSASLGNMVSVRHKQAHIPVVESNAIGMAYG